METLDYIKIYRNASELAFSSYYSNVKIKLTEEERSHIIGLASSIMMHRDGILHGGHFVTAICSNDLYGAFSRADSTTEKSIKFLVYVNKHEFIN